MTAGTFFQTYDGRILTGTIRRVGNKFVARDARRKLIGKFPTVRKAADAISNRCQEHTRNG